jgi:hypothetical protein
MANHLFEYQLRIRNAANSADVLTATSVRGGTNPWLSGAPSGDGQSFDPLSGKSMAGAFSGKIVDGITSGTSRVMTSQLEDSGLRQQLMDRRAFLEYRIDGGAWLVLIAGFLTGLRLVTGIEYEYTVSDPTRAEHEFTAFKPNGTETIATFVARWPSRGCIFGGPVIGGFLGQADRGGWEMLVNGQSNGTTFIKFVAGYAPPSFERSTNAEQCMTAANEKTDGLWTGGGATLHSSLSSFQDARDGQWPGVVIEIIGQGYFQPNDGFFYAGFEIEGGLNKHLLKDIRMRGLFIRGTTLTVSGTVYRVRAFTAEASEMSPIYWTGHPADLLATLWTEAGLSYDAAAITTAKNAIGADRRLSIRVTEPQPLAEFLESTIYGPFGIGVRTNTAGELVAFSSRIFANTPPTTAITTADVVSEDGGTFEAAFEIDQATAVKKVVFEHTRLVQTQDAGDATYPDGFVPQVERFERTNSDTGAVGSRVQEYRVPGMVHSNGVYVPELTTFVDAIALEILDRYGRGVVAGGVAALRGGSSDTVLLGDEILNNLPRLPNHNKRLGDDLSVAPRAMQIVRSTWTPRGPLLKLIDSGPNAQPYATVPTHTIAASATFPRTVAEVTITNAAALNADSAGLRLQMAVTTGAAPATTDYVDVGAYAPGEIPTSAIVLPPIVSGRKVYARAAATKVGVRFSAWSTGVSVTLTAVPPVTSLVATTVAGDGSTEQLTWTAGDATSVLDIFIRASGAAAADAVRIAAIPPSSTRYLIEGLTPSTAYTAGVQARDEATGDVSAMVDVNFTTGATVVTLAAPVSPAGFAGSLDPDTGVPLRDAVYGMAVIAADNPGFTEVQVAVETAIGAGTYGAFVTSGTVVPNVLGAWTIWQDNAPNDGLHRQIKARHVRTGATASAYTSVVTVLPWTPAPLPGFPTAMIVEIEALAPTEPGVNMRFMVTGIDPAGGVEQVKLVSLSSNVGIVSGSAIGTLAANGSIWKLSQPAPGSGPGSAVFAAVVGGSIGEASVQIPEATTLAVPQGTVAIDAGGNWQATVDGPANTLSFKWSSSTSAYVADATVASSGTLATGSRLLSITGGPLTFGQTVFITIIPYTGASAAGVALPSIHIRGAYLTYTPSKTTTYAPSAWQDVTDIATRNVPPAHLGTGEFQIYPSAGNTQVFQFQPTVPDGVTLTQAAVDLGWAGASSGAVTSATIRVYRRVATISSATSIGSTTFTTGSQQTKTISLSESTTGRTYYFDVAIVNFTMSGGLPDMFLGNVALTYTMGDPSKTV